MKKQMLKANKFLCACVVVIVLCSFMSVIYPYAIYGSILCITIANIYMWRKAPAITQLPSEHVKTKTYQFLIVFSVGILIAYGITRIFGSFYGEGTQMSFETIRYTLLTLFILVVGNLSPKIPFNRNLGLRLPWTIRDEDTWRYAHRILGYMSFPCVFVLLAGLLCNQKEPCMIIAIMIWIAIPSIASYQFSHRKERL